MARIPTPSLADLARPYREEITSIWDDGFQFSNNLRNDIVETARMDGRIAGAEREYLDNMYGVDSARATYGDRLQADRIGAQNSVLDGTLTGMGTQADIDFFGTKRGIDENAYVDKAELDRYNNEDNVGIARANIERRAHEQETNRRVSEAPGASPLEKSVSALNTAMGDPSTPAAVTANLHRIVMSGLTSQLAVLPPNSPEYARVKSLLIMYGGYGVPAVPSAPPSAPRPTPSDAGATVPGGFSYGIPGGSPSLPGMGQGGIGFGPSVGAPPTPAATDGGWTP